MVPARDLVAISTPTTIPWNRRALLGLRQFVSVSTSGSVGLRVLPGVPLAVAVVAAGSVVTDDVPTRTVVAGVPARPVRTLNVPDGWRRG
jgi:hypothetical protein